MEKNEKKPAHEVMVKTIIDDFDRLEKVNNRPENYDGAGFVKALTTLILGVRICVLLRVLKEMVIPDKALAEFVDAMETPKSSSPEDIRLIVLQLKKL